MSEVNSNGDDAVNYLDNVMLNVTTENVKLERDIEKIKIETKNLLTKKTGSEVNIVKTRDESVCQENKFLTEQNDSLCQELKLLEQLIAEKETAVNNEGSKVEARREEVVSNQECLDNVRSTYSARFTKVAAEQLELDQLMNAFRK